MKLLTTLFLKIVVILKLYIKIFIIVMFLNQLLFFGLCLNPLCLIAATPHVLLITMIIGTLYYKPSYKKVQKSLKFMRQNYDDLKEKMSSFSNKKKKKNIFTGNIYLFVTQNKSKSEEDFHAIIKRYPEAKVISKIRLDNKYKSKSLLMAISKVKNNFITGDIVAIVRGGGDTNNWQFDTYKDVETCNELKKLYDIFGVVSVSGIGHATDNFPIEKAVNFAQITPTDAAMQIALLIKDKKFK